jgi:hypothetical protein
MQRRYFAGCREGVSPSHAGAKTVARRNDAPTGAVARAEPRLFRINCGPGTGQGPQRMFYISLPGLTVP